MTMPFSAATIPQELKERAQWVVWKSEYRDNKLTKIPYNALSGLKAKANDRSTWANYDACVQAMESGFNGVGFEFNKEDGITGIDFDECIDPETGKIAPDVREMIERLDSYTEVSQSGRGVHVLVKATLPGNRNRKEHVEMYDDNRFFAITGQCLPDLPHTIEPRQDELNAIYHTIFRDLDCPADPSERIKHTKEKAASRDVFTDEDIIKKAEAAKNGDKFRRLFWDGDCSGYPSQSEADLGLCSTLRFWCGDNITQIDRIFRRSALFRAKWDEQHGEGTYGDMTISEALHGSNETYMFPPQQAAQIEDDEIYITALELLKKRDFMSFYLETFKTLHVGDLAIAEGILLGTAAQSVKSALGIQSKLTGAKGKGKSHAARSAMHLHPQDYVRYVSLTDKAIWYDPEIKTGCTIFSDDVNISTELEGQLKRATSNWQRETERVVPQKIGGKIVGEVQKIPARINWILTSVDSQGSEELIDRQMGYDVDEAQDAAYIDFELKRADDADVEFPETNDVRVCREAIRILKENEDGTLRVERVRVPFYDRISWNDPENRRNLNIFLDMVRAFAMLRFMQRERDADDKILATEEDFRAAQRHYGDRAEVQKLHLTSGALRFLQYLRDKRAVDEYSAIDSTEMRNALKLTKGRISQVVAELDKSLYNFHVIERYETEEDTDKKRSGRRKHLYYIEGGLTLNLENFESVVSLKTEKLIKFNFSN
jgi:hypothetical protein